MNAIVTIKADNGEILGQYEMRPTCINDDGIRTVYCYEFQYAVLNEREKSIPHTETHIVTDEDIQLAYNRGYMEGMKRGMIGG